jgi:hypothetical protein
LKHLLEGTVKDLQISNINSVGLVVNDIGSEGRGYGYGYGYRRGICEREEYSRFE